MAEPKGICHVSKLPGRLWLKELGACDLKEIVAQAAAGNGGTAIWSSAILPPQEIGEDGYWKTTRPVAVILGPDEYRRLYDAAHRNETKEADDGR